MSMDELVLLAKEAGMELYLRGENDFTAMYSRRHLQKFAALIEERVRDRHIQWLLSMHHGSRGKHNYYHVAANLLKGE